MRFRNKTELFGAFLLVPLLTSCEPFDALFGLKIPDIYVGRWGSFQPIFDVTMQTRLSEYISLEIDKDEKKLEYSARNTIQTLGLIATEYFSTIDVMYSIEDIEPITWLASDGSDIITDGHLLSLKVVNSTVTPVLEDSSAKNLFDVDRVMYGVILLEDSGLRFGLLSYSASFPSTLVINEGILKTRVVSSYETLRDRDNTLDANGIFLLSKGAK